MSRSFNIAGPCYPDEHYMILSKNRYRGVRDLIAQSQYFVIHSAPQSGKTTLLKELVREVSTEGTSHAIYCSLESVQGLDDPEQGIPGVIAALKSAIDRHPDLSFDFFEEDPDASIYNIALLHYLTLISQHFDKPLVILFDEIDCLTNGTLIAFLYQLREGYASRRLVPFVPSVGLIGMRNIRDYKGKIREERETLGSTSPFNIVTEALTLRNFTRQEIADLYAQHTADTGQVFPEAVVDAAFEWTGGQPWLVNAIAREIVMKILESDISRPILPEYVEQAAQAIMLRRDTHIDSLLERLKEERVRRIVEPVIVGENTGFDFTDDDFQYVLDLGLLTREGGPLRPSNPIYADTMLRKLSSGPQMAMDTQDFPPLAPAYLEDGRLDMRRLLADFQTFWRENSAIWEERFQYKEAAPHLILMAFVQRVINAGGRIDRELALGRGRVGLCLHYQGERYPVEIKVRRDAKSLNQGVSQLAAYMASLDCDQGWLVFFDRRKRTSWKNRLFWKEAPVGEGMVFVAGC